MACRHFGSSSWLIFESSVRRSGEYGSDLAVVMEPTPSQIAELTTCVKVCAWAQLSETHTTSFLGLLGVEPGDHPRVLAAITEGDWVDSMSTWKVGEVKAAPAIKAKAAVARGAAVLISTGRRLGEPAVPTPAAPAASAPDATTSAAALGKFKLNTIISQTSDVELRVLDGEKIKAAYAAYKGVFGGPPPPAYELTVEQLTALKGLLEADMAPYVDFAIWGPHGNRTTHRLKLAGVQFASDGSLFQTEIAGPPTHDHWVRSYACLRTHGTHFLGRRLPWQSGWVQ